MLAFLTASHPLAILFSTLFCLSLCSEILRRSVMFDRLQAIVMQAQDSDTLQDHTPIACHFEARRMPMKVVGCSDVDAPW